MKKISEYINEDRIINAKTPEEIEKFKLELAELQRQENKQYK